MGRAEAPRLQSGRLWDRFSRAVGGRGRGGPMWMWRPGGKQDPVSHCAARHGDKAPSQGQKSPRQHSVN